MFKIVVNRFGCTFHLSCLLQAPCGPLTGPAPHGHRESFVTHLNSLCTAIMSLTSLDQEHLASFKQALANLLSTPTAEFTYAQIVDGMPTRHTYITDHNFYNEFPVLDHEELCPGTMDKTRAFRSEFDILSLRFEPRDQHNDTALHIVGP